MECTRRTFLFRKYQRAQEFSSFYVLTSHFPSFFGTKGAILVPPSLATPITPTRARALTIHGWFINSLSLRAVPVVNFDVSQTELHSFTASLLVYLDPLIAWNLANSTPVTPTTASKRHVLLPARV